MTDTVSAPAVRCTRNRRKNKRRIYQSASWKRKKAEFVKGKKCEWCGEEEEKKLLPHHPYKNTPDDAYQDLYLSECVVLCQKCHFMFERRHKVICPKCLTNYMPADPSINCCWQCHLKEHPEEYRKIQERKAVAEQERRRINSERAEKRRRKKVGHPCRSFGFRGQCLLSPIDARCTFSKRKAMKPVEQGGCNRAVAKKGKKQHQKGTGGAR